MKISIERIRNILNKNKIFFEVIVATALTFMGIYVSIQANKIAKNQTKIMELENTPQIEIRKTQVYNDSLKIYDITMWYIYNHNSKISNFDIVDEASFINLTKNNQSYDIVLIPIRQYLNLGGTIHGNSEGLIFEFDNKYSGYDEYLTRQAIWNYGLMTIDSYIEISFSDVLNKNDNRYFKIAPSIKEINRKTWDSVKTIWDNKREKSFILTHDINDNIKQIKRF